MRSSYTLTDDDIVTDPIGKGSGRITRYMVGYQIEDDSPDSVSQKIDAFISFMVTPENDLFKKIKAFPLRVQKIPLVITLAGEKYTVQLRSIKRMSITEDFISITDAAVSVLDNLEFLEVLTRERWLWSEHIKKND